MAGAVSGLSQVNIKRDCSYSNGYELAAYPTPLYMGRAILRREISQVCDKL